MPKVMLIDDEEDIVHFEKAYLTRRNYQVITANNTQDALDLITKEKPDVVFCDVRLERDTSGLHILEEAKKIDPAMPIYLLTGLVDSEIEEKGRSLGAQEILHKPLSNDAIEAKIKEVIPG